MKIILASFLYESEIGGGASVVLNQLVRMLIRDRHEVIVLTTWPGPQVKTEHIDGSKIIRLPASNLYWVADKDRQPVYKKVIWQLIDIWNPLIYQLVRQICLQEKPDIFHSHKLRGLSPSIWRAAASSGIKKIIHTCHDYELLSPEGFFMGWAGRLAQKQNILMRPYQSSRRHFSRWVTCATAPSRFVLNYHQKIGFFSQAKVAVIPNSHGFDLNELNQKRAEFSRLPKKRLARRFLYLGRLDKAKGIDILCQAFLRIAGQDQDFLLKITGWGPLGRDLMEKYGFQKNIIFTGPVFGDQKAELFSDSDILVAPSVSPEPFGIVIAEAYSQGVPVITSRAGAFPEIVREGETGLLANTGSVDDLCLALDRVSKDNSLITAMSGNCFVEAKKYATEQFFAEYIKIYQADA